MNLKKKLLMLKMRAAKPGCAGFKNELKENERLTVDELSALNLERRKKLVRIAYENSPFYRQKYSKAGFELDDTEQENFFDYLPILEKEEIRENAGQIVHQNYHLEQLNESTTGGSTGAPLKTYQDPSIPLDVLSWRMLNWWGCDVSDNSGYLYRAIPSEKGQLLQKMALWPTKRAWISAADMSEKKMRAFAQKLRASYIKYLIGYVGAVDVFASFCEKEGLAHECLKAVWTTSAPLPEGKRLYLEEVFSCPVYTQYGSCEFYWISAECSHKSGLHIASDVRHVDVVQGHSPVEKGEFGDLVISDLIDFTFPLIRYRIGDRGRLLNSSCSCGLPFPMMDYVKGRISDSIFTPSGKCIPGEFWTTIFDDFTSGVKSFNVHQSSDFSIVVQYEPNVGVDCSGVIETVKQRLNIQVDGEIEVSFAECVIDVNDHGKTRFVVSDVVRP